ncbi:hypothetical protein F4802DRAFT_498651 [Xylaria palmicola]|nr:hypothetical protein F4802DRAFT_498651 [Xylaria palmicola]
MDELLGWVVGSVLWKGVLLGTVFAVDELVARRRDAIVTRVRRLQSTLKIPACLRVVSETAPGITDKSLRFGAEMAVVSGVCSLCAFALVAILGKVKSIWGIVFGIVVPVCLFIIVWIYFIAARRRFDQGERDTYVECAGFNPGLRASIARVEEV